MPPPIGGWNRRDALPLMDSKDALRLDNWVPDTASVHLRSGFATHATIETKPPGKRNIALDRGTQPDQGVDGQAFLLRKQHAFSPFRAD